MLMLKEFPHDYNFFPATYILPYEMNLFKSQFVKKEPEKAEVNKLSPQPEILILEENT
jgi:hypothetical protein